MLDSAIAETLTFCQEQNIDLTKIQDSEDPFRYIELFETFADILLSKDVLRKTFNVYFNTVANLFEACKPEIIRQDKYSNSKELVAILQYLHRFTVNQIDDTDLQPLIRTISNLLDRSVITNPDDIAEPTATANSLIEGQIIDLSEIDLEKLKEKFKVTEHKNLLISNMQAFIQQKIQQMLKINQNRVNFADRYNEIVDNYSKNRIIPGNFQHNP